MRAAPTCPWGQGERPLCAKAHVPGRGGETAGGGRLQRAPGLTLTPRAPGSQTGPGQGPGSPQTPLFPSFLTSPVPLRRGRPRIVLNPLQTAVAGMGPQRGQRGGNCQQEACLLRGEGKKWAASGPESDQLSAAEGRASGRLEKPPTTPLHPKSATRPYSTREMILGSTNNSVGPWSPVPTHCLGTASTHGCGHSLEADPQAGSGTPQPGVCAVTPAPRRSPSSPLASQPSPLSRGPGPAHPAQAQSPLSHPRP